MNTVGLTPPEESKVVRIESTLGLADVDISEALLEDAKLRTDLEVIGELTPLAFNADGNLPPFHE